MKKVYKAIYRDIFDIEVGGYILLSAESKIEAINNFYKKFSNKYILVAIEEEK